MYIVYFSLTFYDQQENIGDCETQLDRKEEYVIENNVVGQTIV